MAEPLPEKTIGEYLRSLNTDEARVARVDPEIQLALHSLRENNYKSLRFAAENQNQPQFTLISEPANSVRCKDYATWTKWLGDKTFHPLSLQAHYEARNYHRRCCIVITWPAPTPPAAAAAMIFGDR